MHSSAEEDLAVKDVSTFGQPKYGVTRGQNEGHESEALACCVLAVSWSILLVDHPSLSGPQKPGYNYV